MALTQVGSAAGEAAHDAGVPRQREPLVARRPSATQHSSVSSRPSVTQRDGGDDPLLDAIRRALAPGDPVARLLAGWSLPPARPVVSTIARPRGATTRPA